MTVLVALIDCRIIKRWTLKTVDVVEIGQFHAGETYDMSEKVRLARVIYASVIWGGRRQGWDER